MSRAFVKEGDGEADELPDRPISPHRNLVTPAGLAAIDAELTRLAGELSAASAGDRGLRGRIARDLRYWRARRAGAEVVAPPPSGGMVHFGSTVTVERADGRRQTFRIVGEDEADPAKGTLSWVSPLASALIGKRVGDVVGAGGSEAEIVEIGEVSSIT
jgi:transcription elongation GreA/GreB family factor